ncbi:MAG: hypothetical protein K2Q23_09790, partial [Bryobacteraceae bacterium]|nr:hypothetical protein [Bryobacteraceae bacterium]
MLSTTKENEKVPFGADMAVLLVPATNVPLPEYVIGAAAAAAAAAQSTLIANSFSLMLFSFRRNNEYEVMNQRLTDHARPTTYPRVQNRTGRY